MSEKPAINQTSIQQEISADGIPIESTAQPMGTRPDRPTESTETTQETSTETATDESTESTATTETAAEEPAINLEDFLEASGRTPKPEDTPELNKDAKTTEDTTQDEDLSTTPGADKTKTETISKSNRTVVPASQATSRDYEGIDEADRPLFKQMSNDSFAKMKPMYLEHKQIKDNLAAKDTEINTLKEKTKGIPDNIYEHPAGYVLTPEFGKLSQMTSQAGAIQEHWRTQLNKVRGGAATYEYLGIDEKGNFFRKEMPADREAETQLMDYYAHAQQQNMRLQAKLEALGETHTTKYKDAVGWIQNFEQQSFAIFDKPENKAGWDKVINQTINNFPPAFRSSPLARLLAKSLITVNNLGQILIKQNGTTVQPGGATGTATQPNGKAPIKKVNPADLKKAGPGSRDTVVDSGNTNGKKNEVTIDDFQRIKDGV